jgi:hypothetical protein
MTSASSDDARKRIALVLVSILITTARATFVTYDNEQSILEKGSTSGRERIPPVTKRRPVQNRLLCKPRKAVVRYRASPISERK